jgi:hypothetical protein
MAYVNADNHSWKTDNLQFEIVNTIGAVEALMGAPIISCGNVYD